MAKLPANLVIAPKFDSPFRRTQTPEDARVVDPLPVKTDIMAKAAPAIAEEPTKMAAAAVQEVAPSAPKKGRAPEKLARKPVVQAVATPAPEDDVQGVGEVLEQRFTLRLTQEQSHALDRRVFELKMKGEKINTAVLMRRILDAWIEELPSR